MCCLAFSHQYSTNTTFFPKQLTAFLTCFSRGDSKIYARKKVCLNRVSNSQPPGHGSDMLTTEPPRRAITALEYSTKSCPQYDLCMKFAVSSFYPFEVMLLKRFCEGQTIGWTLTDKPT